MSNIYELLDSIYTMIQKRDMMLEMYNDNIETLKGILGKEMKEAGIDNAEFSGAIAYFRGQTQVEIKDWNALMQYVKKNDAFDILQRRVSPAQLEKRIKAGAEIKGVTITHSQTLIVKDKRSKDESNS